MTNLFTSSLLHSLYDSYFTQGIITHEYTICHPRTHAQVLLQLEILTLRSISEAVVHRVSQQVHLSGHQSKKLHGRWTTMEYEV